MHGNDEIRHAVRRLLQRFDLINSQRLALAEAIARLDEPALRTRMMEQAEHLAETKISARIKNEQAPVYAAIANPEENWPDAIERMLDVNPTVVEGKDI